MIKQNKSNLRMVMLVALAMGGVMMLLLGTMRVPGTAFAHAAAQATTAPASTTVTDTGTISSTTEVTSTNACGTVMTNEVITQTSTVTSTVATPEPSPTVEVTATEPVSATAVMSPTKVLRIGEDIYPATLDPQRASFVNEFEILSLAYEGLVTVDAKGNVQAGAASDFNFSADHKALTFTLQPNLKRVDGTPITSKDFANAIKRGIDPCLGGRQYASSLYAIQGAQAVSELDVDNSTPADLKAAMDKVGIQTPNDQTLVFQFAQPVGDYWLYVASLPIFYPTDTNLAASAPDNWDDVAGNHNGNGPFVILTLDEGNAVTLVANPNYRLGPPKLDRIEFHYNTDNDALLQAYKNGDLDIDAAVAAEQVPGILSDTIKSEFQQYDSAQTYALAFNDTVKPFDDRIVRTAFSEALDRASFVKDQLNGVAEVTTRWLAPNVPGAQPDKPGVPAYDPAAAVKTLVNNGYGTTDGKVDCDKLGAVKFTYPDSPDNAARATYIANQLQKVLGCPITTEAVDATQFTLLTNDVSTDPQMSLQRWVEDYPHPQNWMSTYWNCGGIAERFGYCNLFLDDLMAKADSTTDFEAALKLYGQAEDLLIQDVPGAFLYNPYNLGLVKPYVMGPPDNESPRDAGWVGQWGPVSQYDIDLSKVPSTYPGK